MTIYSIYKITNKVNGKQYIGYTSVAIKKRFSQHIQRSKKSNDGVHGAIQKYGRENFIVETVYQSYDRDHTFEVMEPYFIAEYDTFKGVGYNLTEGGDKGPDVTGLKRGPMKESTKKILREQRLGKPLKHSQEHKDYLSEKMKKMNASRDRHGSNNTFFGKTHSEETLEKLRKPKSEEHKKKLSEAKKGSKRSAESRKNQSRALRAKSKTLCCGKWYDAGNLAKHRRSKNCMNEQYQHD